MNEIYSESGTVTCLRGEYFDDTTFTALKLTRVDPTVNFNWLYDK